MVRVDACLLFVAGRVRFVVCCQFVVLARCVNSYVDCCWLYLGVCGLYFVMCRSSFVVLLLVLELLLIVGGCC